MTLSAVNNYEKDMHPTTMDVGLFSTVNTDGKQSSPVILEVGLRLGPELISGKRSGNQMMRHRIRLILPALHQKAGNVDEEFQVELYK